MSIPLFSPLSTTSTPPLANALLDAVDAAMYVYAPEGDAFRCVMTNAAQTALTGDAPALAAGTLLEDLLVPAHAAAARDHFAAVLAARAPITREVTLAFPTGDRVLSLTVAPVFDDTGGITFLVGTTRDLTVQRQAERALREREEQHRTVLDSLDEGVVLHDATGALRAANPAAERMLGLSHDALLERSDRDPRWRLVHEDGTPMPADEVPAHQALVTGCPCRDTIMGVYRPDGALTWLQVNARPLFHPPSPVPQAVVVSFVDITTRHKAAKAEQRARQQADAASSAKSDFLAYMSHELRTPLNAIIGFADLLRDEGYGPLNAQQQSFADDIFAAGEHLLSLVNDILDLSKIESGHMTLQPTRLDLPRLLDACATLLRGRADAAGVTLVVHTEHTPLLYADARKVKQMLFNLLANAINFTPSGGHVSLTAREVEGGVAMAVTDTGVGIGEADRARIFDEFVQVGEFAGRQERGTGLGLALTRRLVELHGGTITMESAVANTDGRGTGTTFTVWLPQRTAEAGGRA